MKILLQHRECITAFRAVLISIGMSESEAITGTTIYSSMKPYIPHEVLLYLGGWNARKGSPTVLFYDTYTNHWTRVPTMELPTKLAYHRVFQVGEVGVY